ncbi:hypothetical protein [Lactobacillus phage Semele]|uniref:Uncharacterized protein n=1 Tax=Lactobacillus phage Semele TaxID=2079433 RepID=A0A2K9VD13_9CAUD|nr:HNH endonuclease [Lactobacillus phage Semele]AUV60089.1 hypothetical protein [Lactobacillus phage Semele]
MIKFSKKEKSHRNKEYRKLYAVWHHMMVRCYNPKDKEYGSYGGSGVTVAKEWKTFDGFCLHLDSIDGWDLDKFMNSEIQLDKDYKAVGNKVYSEKTCAWVSPEVNKKLRPNLMKPFIIIFPDGKMSDVIYNKRQAQREYSITSETLENLLKGTLEYSLYGLQAVYLSKVRERKLPKTVYCRTPEGVDYAYYSKWDAFNKINGISPRYINECLVGRFSSSHGYQITYNPSTLVDPTSIQYNRVSSSKENIGYLVCDTVLNTEYCIIDENKFKEYSGINPKVVHSNAIYSKDRQRKPHAKFPITKFNKFSNDYRKDSLLYKGITK